MLLQHSGFLTATVLATCRFYMVVRAVSDCYQQRAKWLHAHRTLKAVKRLLNIAGFLENAVFAPNIGFLFASYLTLNLEFTIESFYTDVYSVLWYVEVCVGRS